MPRNLSAWIDLAVHLIVMFCMSLLIFSYNTYLGLASLLLWIILVAFAGERSRDRERRFERYFRSIVRSIDEMTNYAVSGLPQAILIVGRDGHLEWCNNYIAKMLGYKPAQGTEIREFWSDFDCDDIWGKEGLSTFTRGERSYRVKYMPVIKTTGSDDLMVFYVEDYTTFENLKRDYANSRTVIAYVQIDNYEEIMQGQTETEKSALLLAINQQVDFWLKSLGGFMRRVSNDLYVVVMEKKSLDKAMENKFEILDRIRVMQNTKRLPVTLSMGIAVADKNTTLIELGEQAQAKLDLALGRGGDQVALDLDGKTHFFGGKTSAVEKHTRVKARVVSHALKELMDDADTVYIMGHQNEDYDCFGAALGLSRMAKHLGKRTHVVLSDMTDGIDRFEDLLAEAEEYNDLFLKPSDVADVSSSKSLLIVVDAHIPHILAAPALLERIPQIVVIDHHRRSENFVKNPLLVYIETSASSASELVTELLTYTDGIRLNRYEATALYSGIVVDTKHFAIQAGVRTFDAAAYLRRSGADPVMVRHLFQTDYETTVALARAKASAQFYEGGLVVGICPEIMPNCQIIAAQAADALLRVDDVRMSIYVFQLTSDTVGISARSTGDMNVQVIMEQFGGGGHGNVAGAQVKGISLMEVRSKVVEISKKYIEERDKSESNLAAGR